MDGNLKSMLPSLRASGGYLWTSGGKRDRFRQNGFRPEDVWWKVRTPFLP